MRSIKLNGWQRLGAVLSVLWVLGCSLWVFIAANDDARSSAAMNYNICRDAQNSNHADMSVCSNAQEKNFHEYRDQELKNIYWALPLIAFVPIILAWLPAYLLVKITSWIAGGGLPQPVARHVGKLPVVIFVIVALWFGYQYQHKQNKLRAAGHCQLTGEKFLTDNDRSNFIDHMEGCMRAEGFEFSPSRQFCSLNMNPPATDPDCYE